MSQNGYGLCDELSFDLPRTETCSLMVPAQDISREINLFVLLHGTGQFGSHVSSLVRSTRCINRYNRLFLQLGSARYEIFHRLRSTDTKSCMEPLLQAAALMYAVYMTFCYRSRQHRPPKTKPSHTRGTTTTPLESSRTKK